MDYTPKEYPVFRRMDENLIAGISGKTLLLTLAAAALGVAIYAGLGLITVEAPAEIGYAESAEMLSELEQMRDALRYEELLALAEDAQTPEELDAIRLELGVLSHSTLKGLGEEDIAFLASEAKGAGLAPGSTSEQIDLLLPATQMVSEPAISSYHRLIVALLPAVLTIALRFEANGASLLRHVRNASDYKRSQKEYFYRSRTGEIPS